MLLNIESFRPWRILARSRILEETIHGTMNDMKLSLHSAAMDDSLAVGILRLKQHLGATGIDLLLARRRNAHGVAQEVPNVGAEAQQRLVRRVLGPLDVLQSLGCFGPEPRQHRLRLLDDVRWQVLCALRIHLGGVGGSRSLGFLGGGLIVVGCAHMLRALLRETEGSCAVEELREVFGRGCAGACVFLLSFLVVVFAL